MLRPAKIARFYIAVPQNLEERVVELIGKLGYIEITPKETAYGHRDITAEKFANLIRIYDRLKVSLNVIDEYLPKRVEKKGLIDKFKSLFVEEGRRVREYKILKYDQLDVIVDRYSKIADEVTSRLDKLRKNYDEVKEVIEKIELFKKYNLMLDMMGEYEYITVKAGFMPDANISRLMEVLKPYNVILDILDARPREKLVLIAFSNKDKAEILNILTMLNFDEIKFPKDTPANPEEALKLYNNKLNEIIEEFKSLKGEIVRELEVLEPYMPYVKFVHKVKNSLIRTRNFSVLYGWIPQERLEEFKRRVDDITNGRYYIEAIEAEASKGIKPPTLLKHPKIIDRFQLLVKMRGIPSYNEIDPTIFFMVLFIIMYGMMFGDVGEGVILFIMGLFFYKIRRNLIGVSYRAWNSLGVILMLSSISAIVFGFLYGESFLLPLDKPLWFKPIEPPNGPIMICVYSILFGVAQLILGLILNIINNIMNKRYEEALLSWRGVVGLVYYLIGIVLAIRFVTMGMTLDVFVRPENIGLSITLLALLGFIFFKPAILNVIHKTGESITMSLMEGFSELIEMFLSYITNSLSYVRLGAFAIAHEALALAAEMIAPMIGFLPSYLIFNALVIVLEGFACGIQSIRLLFYEFSTKFYEGEGKLFTPLRIQL